MYEYKNIKILLLKSIFKKKKMINTKVKYVFKKNHLLSHQN